jgi:hypothetical protein
VIWRERAFFEDWPRFAEIEEILLAKYGARLQTLGCTGEARFNLVGDSLSSGAFFQQRAKSGWAVRSK